MVDWGEGAYETTAAELEPVAHVVIERACVGDEVRNAMTDALREANEDPGGFLVHSPYVVHELRPA
jgi:hypothetical protein